MRLYPADFKLSPDDLVRNIDIVYILSNTITVPDKHLSSESVRSLIERAIIDCKKNGTLGAKEIIQTLNKIYCNTKKVPKKKYVVVASLHLDRSVLPKRSGMFLGFAFKTYESKPFFKKYKFERYVNPPFSDAEKLSAFLLLNKNEQASLTDSNFFELELETIDPAQAFTQGFNAIELFRSFLNYSYCVGTYRFFGGAEKPYSIVLPSAYIFVFDENHNLLQYWYTLGFDERSNKIIDKGGEEKTESFCKWKTTILQQYLLLSRFS